MNTGDKIRVAVLFGGRSAEHEISLHSAKNVIQYLDPARFDVVPIGIDKQGNWFLGNDIFSKSLAENSVPKLMAADDTWFTPRWVGQSVEKTSLSTVNAGQPFDVVFPVVHGSMCEDGTLQGLLELADLPYVGCGVLASSMGMDKDISKRLAMLAGVKVAPYVVIKLPEWQHLKKACLQKVADKLDFPVFVKPANTGSSVGINKVKEAASLEAAIEEAFRYDTKILVEKGLDIIELEIAALQSLNEKDGAMVSVAGEIRPSHEFYSYDAKYIDENGAQLLIPAPIPDATQQEAQAIAKTLFAALECEGMARIDLFLTKDTHEIYFNEINTIPGFTKISMYPKLMEASGVSYTQLLTNLIELAMRRHEQKQLVRSFKK